MTALILAVLLLWPIGIGAQEELRPPCGSAPVPFYADVGASPNIMAWSNGPSVADWKPPRCTGWPMPGFRMLVAVAASIRNDGGAEDLLASFGHVSALQGVRYWSVKDQDWQVFVVDAAALDGPDMNRRRADFTVAEMKSGRNLYFMQDDNRSLGKVIYRMRVRESGPDRVVIEVENVTPVRVFLFTLLHPGDLQSLYYLDRRAPGVWGFYNLSRTAEDTSWLTGGHIDSFVNRMVALYRHVAGIPTDQNPPARP